MYYKNIMLFVFMALIFALFATALFPTPTSGLIIMFLIGFLVVFHTIAILKGPGVKDNASSEQWYEDQ